MDKRISTLYDHVLHCGPLSNQELSGKLGLSPASLTHLIQSMEQRGLLRELPAQNYPPESLPTSSEGQHRSRRKTTFAPNPDAGSTLVFSCMGSHIYVRVARFDLRPDDTWSRQVDINDAARCLEACLQLVKKAQRELKPSLRGLAIILPWHYPSGALPSDFPQNLAETLKQASGLPLAFIQEAQALALAEAYTGTSRRFDHFMTLYIHEGLDLAIFIGGRLMSSGLSQHPSHDMNNFILDPQGPSLPGFPRGSGAACLSRPALTLRLQALGYQVEHHETWRVLHLALQRGTPGTEELLVELSSHVALTTVNLLALAMPQHLVIFCPLNELGPRFTSLLEKSIRALLGDEKGNRAIAKISYSLEWNQALTSGAAKAGFDAWLNTLIRIDAFPEESEVPAKRP